MAEYNQHHNSSRNHAERVVAVSTGRRPRWRHVSRLFSHLSRWRRTYRRYVLDLRAQPHPRPIFILGHQKSGTSVIADLLGQMCGLTVAIDLKRDVHRPAFQLVQFGDLSFDAYRRRNAFEFSHDIIKEANLTPMFVHLHARYPKSQYVFVVRDPRDNIRSILQRLGLSGNPNDVPGDAWRLVVSDTWELILDGGWLGMSCDDYVDGLARRWQLFADVYAQHRDCFITVRYEDFVADKVGTIERLAARLGFDAQRDISHLVDVQHQHKGDPGVSLHAFFGSADRLGRIERICADGMRMLGYDDGSWSRDRGHGWHSITADSDLERRYMARGHDADN